MSRWDRWWNRVLYLGAGCGLIGTVGSVLAMNLWLAGLNALMAAFNLVQVKR